MALLAAAAALPAAFVDNAYAGNRGTWSGAYVGFTVGGAKSEADLYADLFVCDTCTFDPVYSDAEIAAIESSASPTLKQIHVTGGIVAGITKQFNRMVLGFEADFGAFRFRKSYREAALTPVHPVFLDSFAYDTRVKVRSDWLATFRARGGFLVKQDVLIYATAGLAASHMHLTTSYSDDLSPPAAGKSSDSDMKVGWIAGGGLEWAIGHGWSLKGEYLHVDLGETQSRTNIVAGSFDPSPLTTRTELTSDIGRFGMNYRY